jgi:hypothetical protein
LTAVNIVFSASYGSKFQEWIIATEDPSLSQVENITVQSPSERYVTYVNVSPWGGYQFYGNLDQTANVLEALGTWAIPTPNEGYTGQCNNSTNTNLNSNCQLAVWTGLTHDSSGSYIAQDGTASTLECKYSGSNYQCTRVYQLWTEWYPASPVYCALSGISAGDSIQSYALNQAVNPGGNSNLYNLQVSDTTANKACTITGHDFSTMGLPKYGEFLIETPGRCDVPPNSVDGNFGCGFPSFTALSISGNIYYGGLLHGIYVPYQNGWYTTYHIQNKILGQQGVNTNSNFTTVSSSNSFNQIWLNSLDTY